MAVDEVVGTAPVDEVVSWLAVVSIAAAVKNKITNKQISMRVISHTLAQQN